MTVKTLDLEAAMRWISRVLVTGLIASGLLVPTAPAQASHSSELRLSATQVRTINSVTNVFENGDLASGYAAIEDYDDGCGYTAGYLGFCTATGDLLDVVTRWAATGLRAAEELAAYLPVLRRLAADESTSHVGLGGFVAAWRRAGALPAFQAIQRQVGSDTYLQPALVQARRDGLRSALAALFYFDTGVQMGPDGPRFSPDGLGQLRAETRAWFHGRTPATGVCERAWLRRFNVIRRQHLLHPRTRGRETDWPESVDRVDALNEMLQDGRWDLALPLRVGADFDVVIR